MDWYYADGDEQKGPVTQTEFDDLVASGSIGNSTLVWHEELGRWRPHSEVSAGPGSGGDGSTGLSPKDQDGQYSTALQPCRECGRGFSTEEMLGFSDRWVCAECKPIFFLRVKAGVQDAHGLLYAGFWIRLVAKIIDSICLGVVGLPLQMATASLGMSGFLLYWTLSTAIGIGYSTWFVGRFGATPGKMALGLKVVRPDGTSVSYMRAAGRFFGEWVSSFILLMGYVIAGFDEEKRALHDRICDTRVVSVR